MKAQFTLAPRQGQFTELGPDAKGGVRLANRLRKCAPMPKKCSQDLVTIQRLAGQAGPAPLHTAASTSRRNSTCASRRRKRPRRHVASTEGGMDIEKVAHDTPDKIQTLTVDPATGLMPHHGRAVAAALGLKGDLAKQAGKLLPQLYNAFVGTDASQIEINPLAVTDDGKLLVLDAKVGFDNNAEFRHPDLQELRDLTEEVRWRSRRRVRPATQARRRHRRMARRRPRRRRWKSSS